MTLRFGRLPAQHDPTLPRLATYLTPVLAPPPQASSVLPRVYAGAHESDPTVLFPMLGNDAIGDCVVAAMLHAQTVYRGMTGSRCIAGTPYAEALYFRLTGGQDSGLVESTTMQYWHHTPVNHDRILGSVAVDPRNHLHVQQAIALFGGVLIGFQVQQDCIAQFEARQPWTPGPLTNEGHAVYVVGYDQQQIECLTWGNTQYGTWPWWDACVDECYAIVPPEAYSLAFAPGLNTAALLADLAVVRA